MEYLARIKKIVLINKQEQKLKNYSIDEMPCKRCTVSLTLPVAKAVGGPGEFSADMQRSTETVGQCDAIMIEYGDDVSIGTGNTAAACRNNDVVAVEGTNIHHRNGGCIESCGYAQQHPNLICALV
jgi:hypothetical protein